MKAITPLPADEARTKALSMGLLKSEYDYIEQQLKRPPTETELTVFAGMWSEHCSYKSTLQWLRDLPTEGPGVLAGPGSHAGTVDVGEGWAVSFKVESHNHPSAVEPYQGAATGVGGILRDIFAQGARPCAVMDSLCFGMPHEGQTDHLLDGVVAGIAGYGNAFGVPNVGGRTFYDPRYEGNPLVNALAAGLIRHDGMRTADARGVGNPVLYVGASTGRDGILGAAFASEELSDDSVEDRPHVQVGDPFTGKKLMEACLSYTEEMGLIACQDMGASGITCAAVEMAAAGKVGIEIDLETIPLREDDMSAQEIMLSESQERFMFVIEAGTEQQALDHFHGYDVHAVICGRVTEGTHARALYRGEVVVDVPAELVADGAPLACWDVAESMPAVPAYPAFEAPEDLGATLANLLQDPCIADMAPLFNHYDQTVGNRTVRGPGQSEAAVLKLPDSERGFALTITNRGDWCAVDPHAGAQALVAETMRNLACAGARMVAVTDGLNVASPRDPVENYKLRETIAGLGVALRLLEVPVTGGNCSLYNESSKGPIPPTPMVGGLGTVENVGRTPVAQACENQVLFLLGDMHAEPSVSRYGNLRAPSDSAQGAPVPVNLAAEKSLCELLITQAEAGVIRAAKDTGPGGIGVALAKFCMRADSGAGVGAEVTLPWCDEARRDWQLFGEYPATAWVSVAADDAESFAAAANSHSVPCHKAGRATGDQLAIEGALSVPLSTLRSAFVQSPMQERPSHKAED